MQISRRAFATAVGVTLLGTVVGARAASASDPDDSDDDHHRGKGRGKGKGVNLLKNPSFELDAAGTTITNWTAS